MKLSFAILSSILGATLALADGEFNVLSFNVAGLPQVLQDNGETLDKTDSTQYIGEAFSKLASVLDVIHVQEDFHYNDVLYEYDTHPYRTESSGDVPLGSGLNTLSNYPWVHFERTKWNTCSDASQFDCWTPKGFTAMRVPIEGAIVNFINLHADAGVELEDEDARNDNLQQVADYIDSYCYDEAVIVFGDTNSRYTRELDNISIFEEQNGLTNPWIVLARDGVTPEKGSDALICSTPATNNSCETVDKVFYRGSKTIELDATAYSYADDFFVYEGDYLSDHNPVLTNFTYTISEGYKTSNASGGYHGTFFNDISDIDTGVKATKLIFKGNERLDSVALTLSDGTTLYHGGAGGVASELELSDDEYWTKAYLCTGKYDDHTRNFYINATTSAGNTLEAGTATEACQYFEAPEGYQISGFYGESGDEIDLLGFIYIKQ